MEWDCERGFRRLLHQACFLDGDNSREGIRFGWFSVQCGSHQPCKTIKTDGQWHAGRPFPDITRGHSDPNANTDANSNGDPETLPYGYSCADGYAYPITNGHPGTYPLTKRHTQARSFSDGNASTESCGDSYARAQPHACSHSDAGSFCQRTFGAASHRLFPNLVG